jgi:hypothetical protein
MIYRLESPPWVRFEDTWSLGWAIVLGNIRRIRAARAHRNQEPEPSIKAACRNGSR